jgi:tetratricopeptide (TPR) repeat protein
LVLFWLGYSNHNIQFTYWENAIALFREVGDLNFLARALCVTARFCVLETGDIEKAQKYLDEAVLVNPLMNKNKRGHVWENAQYARSVIAFRSGDHERAYTHLQEVVVITEESGDRMGYLWARAYLGYVALRAGNLAEARAIFVDTAQKFQEDGNTIGIAFPLEGLASLYVVTGKFERAARLIGWADAGRARIIEPRPKLEQADVDRDIAAIIAKIGNTSFKEAYDSGREMTLDEAVALALNE